MKNFLPTCFYTILIGVFFSCGKSEKSNSNAPVWPDEKPAPADALFKLLSADQTGVDFENKIEEDFHQNIIFNTYLYNGGGVAVIDFNRDGLQDLYFTATRGKCKLFQNKGDFKFDDVTDQAKVGVPIGIKTGVAVADVNGDGWQDLYVSRSGMVADDSRRNLLFLNNHDGTFYEAAKEWGVDDVSAHTMANFFDYDLDGDLDLYILVHPTDFGTSNNMLLKDLGGGKVTRQPLPPKPLDTDRLLRNDGTKFIDVTEKAGILNHGYGLSVNIRDLNDDGFPDIYIGNDFIEPDFIYINNKNGTFSERAQQLLRHMANHCMGVDIADLTNDGLPEIMSLDMLPEPYFLQQQRATTMQTERYNTLVRNGFGHQPMRNILQLNYGNGQFGDIACLAGMFQTDWSWATLMQDFDLDGRRDVFINNGYFRDVTNNDYIEFTTDSIRKLPGGLSPKNFPDINKMLDLIPPFRLKSYFYKNLGDLNFENVSTAWGIEKKSFANGAAYVDLDNDGDLDLVQNNLFDKAFIYKNTAADQKLGNWLQIQLEGSPKNTAGLGAKIRATTDDGQIFSDEMAPMRGYISACQPLVQFGLGKITSIEKLEVEFPGGRLVSMANVPVNQRLTIKFSDSKPGKLTPLPAPKLLLNESTGGRGIAFQHVEDEFDDFTRERLLPWKLSRPGPPLAVADVNGDGLEDFYVGGATNQAGALFLQKNGGGFSKTSDATWELSKAYEDSAAQFFDADGDGDSDLLVASGGNSQAAGSPHYQPRLYLNDGKGGFSRSNDALPNLTESCGSVAVVDLDGDADLDILLGGFCVPGRYPTSPKSFILKNEKGKFSDVTNLSAGVSTKAGSFSIDFEKIGMVRALEIADLDGDKIPEILAAGEWTAIRVFKIVLASGERKLVDATTNFGLENKLGFWRSLHAADFDKDGDMDLVAGNLGLNTRFQASDAAPLTIYASDFDKNGSLDPIMCLNEFGQEKPVALKPLMIKQLPILKKKFVRNLPYALATVEDFFPREILEGGIHLKVNELANVFFENQNGTLVGRPLPNLAQISPINSILSFDANGDGHLDIVFVGNDHGQQVETGRIDSGNGLILLGDGKNNFKPMNSRESGFWANQDARSLRRVKLAGEKSVFLVGNSGGALQVFE